MHKKTSTEWQSNKDIGNRYACMGKALTVEVCKSNHTVDISKKIVTDLYSYD